MLREYCRSDKHLSAKMKHIVVTNVCNLTCGGCHQYCGNFDKEQLWFTKIEDFKRYIEILKLPKNRLYFPNPNYITKISIFGGEPTIHPQWNEMMNIMRSHSDVLFRVSTNGRLHKSFLEEDVVKSLRKGEIIPEGIIIRKSNMPLNVSTLKAIMQVEKGTNKLLDNVLYIIDPKDEEKMTNYLFVPTFVAPIDLYPQKTKKYFWAKAQRDCGMWKYCSATIYNDKAYFCEVAGSMDHLYHGGANGWKVDDSPFTKTPEEIAEQAEKFCYRCSWCIKFDPALEKFKQKLNEPTIMSKTNAEGINIDKKFVDLVQISLPSKDTPPLRNPVSKQ